MRMLTKEGFRVVIESGAGTLASFTDGAYEEAGATVVKGSEAWKSDIVVKARQFQRENRTAQKNKTREGQWKY